MDKEILNKYKKAGNISAKARDYGCELVKKGIKIVNIAEKIEK